MKNNDIAYLIITHNGERSIGPLLESISEKKDVLVWDNCSEDKTCSIVQSYGVSCIEHKNNIGYGAAINAGMDLFQDHYSYVCILNQDIVIRRFVPDISTYSAYTIIQPLILLPNDRINVDILRMNMLGYIYPPHFDYEKTVNIKKQDLFFFSGAAFMINTEKWIKIGTFDSSLFMYYEDIDYAFRVFLQNEKILFDPTLLVTHDYRNAYQQPQKKSLLALNRKVVLSRYLPSAWRRSIFLPSPVNKKGVSEEKRWKVATHLLPKTLLGFSTKQIPVWHRWIINTFIIPYSYIVHVLLKRLSPRL